MFLRHDCPGGPLRPKPACATPWPGGRLVTNLDFPPPALLGNPHLAHLARFHFKTFRFLCFCALEQDFHMPLLFCYCLKDIARVTKDILLWPFWKTAWAVTWYLSRFFTRAAFALGQLAKSFVLYDFLGFWNATILECFCCNCLNITVLQSPERLQKQNFSRRTGCEKFLTWCPSFHLVRK